VTHVALREILTLATDPVPVDPSESYPIAGVYGFGRGVFAREPIEGSSTSYRTLYRLHEGQLVISRLKAFEGAVAIVPRGLDGYFVSQEFPTFAIDENVALPSFVGYLCQWPDFWSMLASTSKGVGARRERVHPEQLLAVRVPLPHLMRQREIVARLDDLLTNARRVAATVSASGAVDAALTEAAIQAAIDGQMFPFRSLGDVAEINPPPLVLKGLVAFVPMRAVDDKLGVIHSQELKDADEVGSGYKQFRNGDVIFARITPCMQNGKSAVVALEQTEVGLGSTEFHVIRPGPDVLAEWVHAIVRTRRFREAAAERFTGTAGQQRVPADFLRTERIPVPPLDDQRRLLRGVKRIEALAADLRDARSSAFLRAQALGASLLNEAFRSTAAHR
jgi:type I restriction enzyme, S subunit